MSLASISASTGKVNQTGNLRHDVSFFEDNKLHPASIRDLILEPMEKKGEMTKLLATKYLFSCPLA
jgi:hypothetical protein